MTKIDMTDLVEWEPDLSPDAQAHSARLRDELAPQVSLMKRIRLAMDLSQVELAEILSVTQSNVSKIEGKDDPTLSVLSRMVAAKGGKLRLQIETAEGDELAFALV